MVVSRALRSPIGPVAGNRAAASKRTRAHNDCRTEPDAYSGLQTGCTRTNPSLTIAERTRRGVHERTRAAVQTERTRDPRDRAPFRPTRRQAHPRGRFLLVRLLLAGGPGLLDGGRLHLLQHLGAHLRRQHAASRA
jgi:hypothetical protein